MLIGLSEIIEQINLGMQQTIVKEFIIYAVLKPCSDCIAACH